MSAPKIVPFTWAKVVGSDEVHVFRLDTNKHRTACGKRSLKREPGSYLKSGTCDECAAVVGQRSPDNTSASHNTQNDADRSEEP